MAFAADVAMASTAAQAAYTRYRLRFSPLSNPSIPKSPPILAMKTVKSLSFSPKSANSQQSVSIHIGDNNYNNYGGGGFGKGGGGNPRSGGGGGGGGGLNLFAAFFLGWAVHMAMTKVEKEMGLLNTLLNAVTWVVMRMRECNDLRYQTLNAVKAMPVGVFKAMVVVVLRCLNNVARGMSFVLLGRSMGSQKGRGGGGCEGGVMSRSSKSKPKAKRKKTEEEKTFRRRAKYFLATLLVAVLVPWSLFGGDENAEEGDEDELDNDD